MPRSSKTNFLIGLFSLLIVAVLLLRGSPILPPAPAPAQVKTQATLQKPVSPPASPPAVAGNIPPKPEANSEAKPLETAAGAGHSPAVSGHWDFTVRSASLCASLCS
jgi:hypothetical protein